MLLEGLRSLNIGRAARSAAWLTVIGLLATNAEAQFSSGSTGADGALDYSNLAPGTIVIFDPMKLSPPEPAGTNIFNFTSITIPTGVTVKLRGDVLNAPVFWLSQGDVLINGTIDLN